MAYNWALSLATKTISNLATGGTLGTASTTVDRYSHYILNQSTAGQTFTFATPTDPRPWLIQKVTIPDTTTFATAVSVTGYGTTIEPGKTGEFMWNGSVWWTDAIGSGTVTSVVLPASVFTVATPSTTPTATLNTQSANLIFAGPTTGAAAAPTFRAPVLADLPSTGAIVTQAITVGANTVTTTLTAPAGKFSNFHVEIYDSTGVPIIGTKRVFASDSATTLAFDSSDAYTGAKFVLSYFN
jgi:hypothetical protein